jgi:hypothetical protein
MPMRMRLDRPKLTFRALVALQETLDGGPVTQGLRLALAYLYATGNGNRGWFDQFWQAARRPITGNTADDFGRRQAMNAAMNAICRSVGMERDAELDAKLTKARGSDRGEPTRKSQCR